MKENIVKDAHIPVNIMLLTMEKRGARYACVLKEIPERWQLETMEGFNNGR